MILAEPSAERALPTPHVGVMQGRLSPPYGDRFQSFPRNSWREEFARGAQAGITCIEWIVDDFGLDVNPLLTVEGHREILDLKASTGVDVRSVCADYFMENPLIRCTDADRQARLLALSDLIEFSSSLGIQYIILPFVDNAKLSTPSEIETFVDLANACILPIARSAGIEIHLETSLTPDQIAGVLSQISDPLFKINYDSGNSSSLGYNPLEEFAHYGNRIGSVHIKDRIFNGGTVPLGTGSANFRDLFTALHGSDYAGSFILQVARGEPGDEAAWISRNREWFLSWYQGGAA